MAVLNSCHIHEWVAEFGYKGYVISVVRTTSGDLENGDYSHLQNDHL